MPKNKKASHQIGTEAKGELGQYEEDSYRLAIPEEGKDDSQTRSWNTCRILIEQSYILKSEKLSEEEAIKDIYMSQGEIKGVVGKRFLEGYTLFQALWRLTAPMKIPEFTVYLHGKPPAIFTRAVKIALEQALDDSFVQACVSKFGAFATLLLYGDAFIVKGYREGKGFPTVFDVVTTNDIDIDPFAVDTSNQSSSQDADEAGYRKVYSYDEFKRLYPGSQAVPGMLPYGYQHERNNRTTSLQESEMEDREIEVYHYFCKSRKQMFIFAGATATEEVYAENKEYPFWDRMKNPDLPVYHFVCFPTVEGLYNWGIGNILYRLHDQLRTLMNMTISALQQRVDPIQIMTGLSDSQKKIAEGAILRAIQNKAQGGMGIVILPDDIQQVMQKSDNKLTVQSLMGESGVKEFQILAAEYDKILSRIGINLDDIPQQEVNTLGQAKLREEATTEFQRRIIDQNALEFRRVGEGILTDMRDLIDDDDDTPIREEIEITEQDKEELAEFFKIPIESIKDFTFNWGTISQILQMYNFEAIPKLKTGAYPDPITKTEAILALAREYGATFPGSTAHRATLKQLAQLSGEPIELVDLDPPMPPQPEEGTAEPSMQPQGMNAAGGMPMNLTSTPPV